MACARAGRWRTASGTSSPPRPCRPRASGSAPIARSPPGTAGAPWRRSSSRPDQPDIGTISDGDLVLALPESPAGFKDATWHDVAPYYDELATRRVQDGNVEQWLADWSEFESMLAEAAALANFAYVCNTADAEREAARLRFESEIGPKADEQRIRLQRKLVELGYVTPELETTVRRFRNQMELFSEANVPLFTQLAKLSTDWSKVIGAMTVDWEGQEKTPQQMWPYLEVNDRAVRERAFRNMFKPYIEQRDTIAALFDQMYDLRQQVAKNAGFPNFRDYTHREKNRFDYTPDDCLRFHAAVEEAIVPVIRRLLERRRSHLGVDRLRPWDLWVDPKGRKPLKPYENVDDFIGRAGHIYENVDPDFRGYFELMAQAGLLDLDNRKGKAPGGFCDSLPYQKLPLIFMNAVARDQKWLELRRRFEGDEVDWSGLDAERIARWYYQPHFFDYPFYYIEYGIAQLGALQVWRNSLNDRPSAVRRYREALALGGTRPLPELYEAAGARLIFDSEGMREIIGLVEEELATLDP